MALRPGPSTAQGIPWYDCGFEHRQQCPVQLSFRWSVAELQRMRQIWTAVPPRSPLALGLVWCDAVLRRTWPSQRPMSPMYRMAVLAPLDPPTALELV